MIYKILFSLVPVLARLFSSLAKPQLGLARLASVGRFASLTSPCLLVYLKRSPRLCYGTAFGLCPPCPSLARRSGVFCRLPAGTGSQAKNALISTPPPSCPLRLPLRAAHFRGQPPSGGRGVGQVCPPLAFACKLGADCPQTPTAGEKKTAEKAVFFSPARILKPKFL
jgi:hypothetical protein